MTNLRSAMAKVSLLTMAVLKTAHGFYVPGVRPHEFEPGEDVPMKVNALTSIHTQVRVITTIIILWWGIEGIEGVRVVEFG